MTSDWRISLKIFWLSWPTSLLLGVALFTFSAKNAPAQQSPSQGVNSTNILTQLATAVAGGQAVSQVQITGTATWNAGSLQDSGTATLTAAADGSSSQMQLLLSSSGQKTETQTGAGSSADCQWSGADGVAHEISIGNCWRPQVWFLPALTLQPSLLPNYVGVVDLGTGTVGFSQNTYRHLQNQLAFSGLPADLVGTIPQQSTSDLGLDQTTLLPAVLAYSVTPDSGGSTPIAIEIHYSNY
jgi:hypothetical protein